MSKFSVPYIVVSWKEGEVCNNATTQVKIAAAQDNLTCYYFYFQINGPHHWRNRCIMTHVNDRVFHEANQTNTKGLLYPTKYEPFARDVLR